jgi:hypothetical protein
MARMRRWAMSRGGREASSHGHTRVPSPNGSDPSPRSVCQKATEKRSHSFMGLPMMTSSAL